MCFEDFFISELEFLRSISCVSKLFLVFEMEKELGTSCRVVVVSLATISHLGMPEIVLSSKQALLE